MGVLLLSGDARQQNDLYVLRVLTRGDYIFTPGLDDYLNIRDVQVARLEHRGPEREFTKDISEQVNCAIRDPSRALHRFKKVPYKKATIWTPAT